MPDTPTANLPEQYQLLMPAWGEKYIRVFLKYTLPSHLAAGNIDALPRDRTTLVIHTRTEDVAVFRSSPEFRQYERDHAVRFESIDDLKLVKENPYQTLIACHERALADAAGADVAFIFLNPDAVYSDGCYRAIVDRFREGKRAVLTQGFRASLPAFAARLEGETGTGPFSLPPRRLARLALDCMHPMSLANVMDGDGNRSVGSYYWRVGDDGLVCRSFHMHPLAVRPWTPVTRLYTTIDHEFVRWACPDPAWVHQVTDSDEMIVVELSEPGHLAEWVKAEKVPTEDVLGWMQEWTNGYHRSTACRSLVVHADPITDEYAAVEREASRFVADLLAELTRRTPQLRPDMEIVFRAVQHERHQAELARQAEARSAESPPAPPPALTPAPAAPPVPVLPPAAPSAFGRLFTRGHRLLNRPLYDRADQLVSAVRTLGEQRQIDDARLRAMEGQGAHLVRRVDGDLARQAANAQQQLTAADERMSAIQAELSRTQHLLADVQRAATDASLTLSNTLAGVKHTHDRLLRLLSLTGDISFSHRDPERPTSQPPLGYSDYDMASAVYRPAFERAIRYLQGNDLSGCVAEFGTYRGFTAQTFAELLRDICWPADLYLYDSFAGLPAPTGNDATSYEVVRRQTWVEGAMAPEADIVSRIRKSVAEALGAERVFIHPGFFDKSLPAHPPREPVAILHIDADLYLSARFVLQHLSDAGLIRDGAVLLMDDYNCNASNPEMGERKALTDFVADNPRWSASPWFAYGWHGQAFFLHDREAAER